MKEKIKGLEEKGFELVIRLNKSAVLNHGDIWVVVSNKKKITCISEGHANRVAEMLD